MKILHISSFRTLSNGQRLQLKSEFDAAEKLQSESITWDVLVFHTGPLVNSFERKVPLFFNGVFLRKLYSWFSILRLYKQYDVVLERRNTFDPFILIFGWFVPNRYTIHHSKEIEELKLIKKGLKGVLASTLEKISGLINSRQVLGFIGVTKEIAEYENSINGTSLPQLFLPNGINSKEITLAKDERGDGINAVFMCGVFSSWHGLDLLLNDIATEIEFVHKSKLKIHLIGHLSKEQVIRINKIDPNNNFILVHWHLNLDEYKNILAKCDFGIGSLAMFRQNLNEGTTLKVREYLASGVPVYSGHKDSALPDDFSYYFYDPSLSVKNMVNFGLKMHSANREEVRGLAIPYIEKENIMKNFVHSFSIIGNS